MASIVQHVNFVSLLLDALPQESPGHDKSRLSTWLKTLPEPISYRQLQRYLDELEGVGWARREKDGKNDRWLRVYRGPRLLDMTRERAFALQLIQHKLRHLMPEQLLHALSEEFKLASEKLNQQCPHEKQWLGKIGEVPSLLQSPDFRPGVFAAVTEALLEDKWLEVDYRNKSGQSGSRKILPLGLASKDGVYYLIGRYQDSTDNRQFRMDRVISACMTDEPFAYPDDFRLVDYMDQGFFNYPNGGKIQLVLRMHKLPARHLQDTPLALDQVVEEVDDTWMRLQATVLDSERLRWWILGFGDQVVVESPADYREQIAQTVARMGSLYAGA